MKKEEYIKLDKHQYIVRMLEEEIAELKKEKAMLCKVGINQTLEIESMQRKINYYEEMFSNDEIC